MLATALCLCGAVAAQSIYTCVDANGRKITADRPIAECTDRTQRELSKTGTVRREIGPSLTARELAAQDAKDKIAAETRARELENKRRDRALLLRYPSRGVHDRERATALAQIDEVIKAASKRTSELNEQRKAIDSEMEFYAKDPAKAPLPLKRRVEENDKSIAVQNALLTSRTRKKSASACALTKSWARSKRSGRWPVGRLQVKPPLVLRSAVSKAPQTTDIYIK